MLIAESETQTVRLVQSPDAGGYGLDALWNDDFHHSAIVAMTGRREAYYSDHRGTPQELISAAKRGYLFQGQRYAWQKQPRGTRTDGLPRTCVRQLPRESRSDCQLRRWFARSLSHVSGPLPRNDGADAADARHADAVPGPGVRRDARRSCTSPITNRSSPGRFRRDVPSSSGSFRASRRRKCRRGCQCRTIRGPSSVASWIGPSAMPSNHGCVCIATCWPFDAARRRSGHRTRRDRRRGARRRTVRAALLDAER